MILVRSNRGDTNRAYQIGSGFKMNTIVFENRRIINMKTELKVLVVIVKFDLC